MCFVRISTVLPFLVEMLQTRYIYKYFLLQPIFLYNKLFSDVFEYFREWAPFRE